MQLRLHCTKNEFPTKDFFSKCDQIHSFLRIWLHLLKKSWMENFIFYAVRSDMIKRNYLIYLKLDPYNLQDIDF